MRALLLSLAAVLAGCSNGGPVVMSSESASQKAVRRYLDENLDDPEYQIVKWIDSSSTKGASIGWGNVIKKSGTAHLVRYRARNRLGAFEIREEWFLVEKGGDVFHISEPRMFAKPGTFTPPKQDQGEIVPANPHSKVTTDADATRNGWVNAIQEGARQGKERSRHLSD